MLPLKILQYTIWVCQKTSAICVSSPESTVVVCNRNLLAWNSDPSQNIHEAGGARNGLNDSALCCVFNALVPQVGDHVPRGKWNLLLSARGEWRKVCIRMNDLLLQACYSFHTLAQHVSVLWISNFNCASIDWANYTHKHNNIHTWACVWMFIGYKMVDRCIKYKIMNTS